MVESVGRDRPGDSSARANRLPLEIRLLGPLEIRVHGAPIAPMRTRKDAWLLALLLLRHDREVDRSWLCGALWPDSAPEDAAYNLRRSLRFVRRALGEAAHCVLAPTPHTLRLETGDADVDLLAFDAAILRGDVGSLQTAVSLYGGPLLEGCLEDWVFTERASRERAYVGALEALAAHALTRGDPGAAAAHLRRVIDVDPLRESAQRRLMEALAACGEYAAVKLVFRDLRQALHRELNAEPDAATSALWERIQEVQRRRSGVARRETTPGGLPRSVNNLIGRETELKEISRHLSASRLVTLTGPGGVGKTRLAIRAAEDRIPCHSGGVYFVDLTPLADAALLPRMVADTFQIREHALRPLMDTLVRELETRSVLLVVDNCEHLVDACAQLVDRLLRGCPDVRILATSRQSLGVPGECVWRAPPLSLPPETAFSSSTDPGKRRESPAEETAEGAAERLLEWDATRLFVERATEARKDLCLTPDAVLRIAEIVRQLDGVPLAIELAATRLRAMSVQQLLERLDDRFGLLTMGSRSAPARAQTLRKTMDWSYDLLGPSEKALLQQLSVFSGGWTLDAAEHVCVPPRGEDAAPSVLDGLTKLVDRSLVLYEEHGAGAAGGRYRMLETIREYASQRLAASDQANFVEQSHYTYFLRLAGRAPRGQDIQTRADLDVLMTEQHNFRTALSRCLARDPAQGVTLAAGLDPLWVRRDRLVEGCDWLYRFLEQKSGLSEELQGEAFFYLAEWKQRLQEYATAGALYDGALALIDENSRPRLKALALLGWSRLRLARGEAADTIRSLEHARELLEKAGELSGSLDASALLGLAYFRAGDTARAAAVGEETLALAREYGRWHRTAEVLDYLGDMALARKDFTEARRYHEEKLKVGRALGDQVLVTYALCDLASVVMVQSGLDALQLARNYYDEALAAARDVRWASLQAFCLNHLARLAYLTNDWDELRRRCGESLKLASRAGELERIASGLRRAAALAVGTGQPHRGAVWLGAADRLQQQIAPLRETEINLADSVLRDARASLGDTVFQAAWDAGKTWQEALDDALKWLAASDG